MPKISHIAFGCALFVILSGCGVKSDMQGAKSDNDDGAVTQASGQGANGNGDSTSFNSDEIPKVNEYVVESGDNLWNIAAKASVYHSGWLYPLIVKANASKIRDTNNLTVGMVLTIPRGLSASEYDVAREEAMANTYVGKPGSVTETVEQEGSASTARPNPQTLSDDAAKAHKGHNWMGLLWLVLAILGALGVWQYFQMRSAETPQVKAGAED
jgi:hypothetical protein